MTLFAALSDAALPVRNPVLIVTISAIIFLVAPLVMQRLRVPGLVGLILAGAVVGPNGLGLLQRSNTIILLGAVGLLYLMFIAGIELDLHDFQKYRHRSVVFGAATFLLPQSIGTVVLLLLGYPMATSILVASMFASHTLLAYPIALRFGIGKNRAVTTAIGGTIITDTAALLVLAVIAAATRGSLDGAFWIRLMIGLALYVAVILLGLPRLARWFFRSENAGPVTEYVFVFAALFASAWLAELAGVEAIIGAFLAGLALNPLIPEHSPLAHRIHFVGEAVFIPFFLLGVGMLVDVRVLLAGSGAWIVMIAMTVTVTLTKWLAAFVTQQLFRFSAAERGAIFGLSLPQAAATLAAALIGVEIGLFDDAILNGTILMILITCIVGPAAVERYGRRIALREEVQPHDPAAAPQRILIPIANPSSTARLMELALALRIPDSREPLYPMTVVPDEPDHAQEQVALAEKLLGAAADHGAAADVPVLPLTRIDHNFANGIVRAAVERRSSMIIIGWDARRTTREFIFGSVLDQLLGHTKQHVLVARLRHPLNTTRRIVCLMPRASDRLPGFPEIVRDVRRMASRLGASLKVFTVSADASIYERYITEIPPDTPLEVERVEGWAMMMDRLPREVRPDDLVILFSSRRGAVSWHPVMQGLPARLGSLSIESFVVAFPSELDLEDDRASAFPTGRRPHSSAGSAEPGRSDKDI